MEVFLRILPIFVLILLGWWLRRREFAGEGFWTGAEKATYYLFFPALLFHSASHVEFSSVEPEMAWALIPGLCLAAVVSALAARKMSASGGVRGALFLGGIRPNVYIPMAVATAALGVTGQGLMAVAVALGVPMVNLFSVLMAARWSDRPQHEVGHPIVEVLMNHLIWACLLGLLVSAMGWRLPSVIVDVVDVLSRPALTLGLLTVGGALARGIAGRGEWRFLAVPSLIRLVISPLLILLIAIMLGVEGIYLAVLVVYGMSPASPSAYVFAVNMRGDTRLLASLITLQTLIALGLIPVAVLLLA